MLHLGHKGTDESDKILAGGTKALYTCLCVRRFIPTITSEPLVLSSSQAASTWYRKTMEQGKYILVKDLHGTQHIDLCGKV
jgi:hypothetical protein